MFVRNYRLLAYFVEIVKCGSVRGAARNLFVTAPVVSKALAELERELGVTLLMRGARSMALTDVGEQVYQSATQMTHFAIEAMSGAESGNKRVVGELSITLPTELAYSWLPPVLTRFKQRHPDVAVSVLASDEVLDLREAGVDLAIRGKLDLEAQAPREPSIARLAVILVCAPTLLTHSKQSAKAMLGTLPFIASSRVPDPSTIAAKHRGSGRRVRFETRPSITVNNGQLMQALAAAGAGCRTADRKRGARSNRNRCASTGLRRLRLWQSATGVGGSRPIPVGVGACLSRIRKRFGITVV